MKQRIHMRRVCVERMYIIKNKKKEKPYFFVVFEIESIINANIITE
jgi:hypothetical protein